MFSTVGWPLLNPDWFMFNRSFGSRKVVSLVFNIAVNNFPRQLRFVIDLQFSGFSVLPLF